MEAFALTTVENGGALGVLFVIFLLGFGWCYFKIKGHDVRLNEGDSHRREHSMAAIHLKKNYI